MNYFDMTSLVIVFMTLVFAGGSLFALRAGYGKSSDRKKHKELFRGLEKVQRRDVPAE